MEGKNLMGEKGMELRWVQEKEKRGKK